jgi:hypothetical protein
MRRMSLWRALGWLHVRGGAMLVSVHDEVLMEGSLASRER